MKHDRVIKCLKILVNDSGNKNKNKKNERKTKILLLLYFNVR